MFDVFQIQVPMASIAIHICIYLSKLKLQPFIFRHTMCPLLLLINYSNLLVMKEGSLLRVVLQATNLTRSQFFLYSFHFLPHSFRHADTHSFYLRKFWCSEEFLFLYMWTTSEFFQFLFLFLPVVTDCLTCVSEMLDVYTFTALSFSFGPVSSVQLSLFVFILLVSLEIMQILRSAKMLNHLTFK